MKRFEMIESVVTRLKDRSFKLMEAEDYGDHVDAAVFEYSSHKARYRMGSLTLVSGIADYPAPSDFSTMLSVDWGNFENNAKPWDGSFQLAQVPDVSRVDEQLHFDPAPSALQIASWGTAFKFKYRAQHVMNDISTTIPDQDDIMVRLAALASACKEIAADCNQSQAFVTRYYTLAKRYHEQFMSMIHQPRPILVRT